MLSILPCALKVCRPTLKSNNVVQKTVLSVATFDFQDVFLKAASDLV